MSAALEQLVGRTLKSAYRLESVLGVGGMGAVFKAVQLAVDRQVAVKVLKPMQEASADMVEQMEARFRREAKLTAKLKHPNTVQLIDFGATDDGMLYLVLEYLEGQELSRAMHGLGGPMPPGRVAHIGQQICQSLAEAHDEGLIHRDLKPDNIFLANYHGERDHVKVMDFGISRIIDDEDQTSALTATGLIIGTPKYMAPEQVEGKTLSARTDLYSLGVILYEMLMGKAPFHAESVMSLAFKHVHEEPPPIDERFGDDWMLLIEMLLAKDPERRPSSASDVAGRLQQLSAASGGMAAGKASWAPLPTPAQTMGDAAKTVVPASLRRKPLGLMVALAVLVLGVVGGLVAVLAGSGDEAKEAKPAVVATDAPAPKEAKVTPEAPKPVAAETPKAAPVPKMAAPAALPTKPTQFKLRTTPKAAKVTRHGKDLCETPCDVPLEGIGETALVIVADGYKARTITVPLRAGSVVDRELVLEKIPAPATAAPEPAPPVAATVPAAKTKTKKKRKKKSTKGGFKVIR